MKNGLICLIAVLAVLFSMTPTHALVLINEPFSSTSAVTTNAPVYGIDTTADYNKWIDWPTSPNHWTISQSGTNYYAQHVVTTTDETNILMYGIDATGLASGTQLTLAFDYLASRQAYAYIVGMDIDSHYLDNYAPWLDGETATDGWEPQRAGTDGVVLAKYTLPVEAGDLGDLTTWYHFVSSPLTWTGSGIGYGDVNYEFDALAIAFTMGGYAGGLRAVDNITLEGTAPVPEPATMLLLGTGLAGLAGFGRKKLFKKA